jgi:hypothetical protein
MIVFRCPFWPVVAFLVAFGLLCLRPGHRWVRVSVRVWVASLVLLTHSVVVRTEHVIKRSLRGTGARLFAEGWRDVVPMLLGTKESRSDLLKIDTPLYPHIAAVHGGKCSVLISAPVR